MKLTTSKTKQFCETSSIFELYNILRDFLNFGSWQHQKWSIVGDFLQKWKVECKADGLVPMRPAIFPFHLSKVLRLPRKSEARSYEVLHLSRKIILANLQIWCSKMQPLSGNQRPDLTSLMNMSFVLRLPRKMHLCRSSSNVPHLPSFLEMLQNPHVLLTFDQVHNPLACHAKRHLNVQKWSEHVVLLTFWLRNVLRATTACTFATSQLPSGPKMVHFDFEMCFAPQRRALFRHLNVQKCSERELFHLQMCFAPQRRALFRHRNF